MRLTALAIILVLPCAAAAQGLQLHVVSNPKPEFVSGGDVLLSVSVPADTQASAVHLTRNGSDVTSAHDQHGDQPDTGNELEEQPCVAPREVDELRAQTHAGDRRLLVEPQLHRTPLRLAARCPRARQVEEHADVHRVRLAGRSRCRLRDDRRARARDQRQGERNDVEQGARGHACYARVPSGIGWSSA